MMTGHTQAIVWTYLRSHLKDYPTLDSWVGHLIPEGHKVKGDHNVDEHCELIECLQQHMPVGIKLIQFERVEVLPDASDWHVKTRMFQWASRL